MNTVVINIKTNPKVKKEAQAVAKDMGLSMSSLINGFLRQVIKTKSVTFDVSEELSDWAIQELKKSSEDIKAGKVISFKDWKEENRYLDKMIADEKSR